MTREARRELKAEALRVAITRNITSQGAALEAAMQIYSDRPMRAVRHFAARIWQEAARVIDLTGGRAGCRGCGLATDLCRATPCQCGEQYPHGRRHHAALARIDAARHQAKWRDSWIITSDPTPLVEELVALWDENMEPVR